MVLNIVSLDNIRVETTLNLKNNKKISNTQCARFNEKYGLNKDCDLNKDYHTIQTLLPGERQILKKDDFNTERQNIIFSHELDKSINSLEDFIDAYDCINAGTFDDYCSKELDGILINRTIDYEAEFENYMKLRGCNNVEELQALNNTNWAHTEGLKNATKYILISFWIDNFGTEGVYSEGSEPYKFAQEIMDNMPLKRMVEFNCDIENSSTTKSIYDCKIKKLSIIKNLITELSKYSPDFKAGLDCDKYTNAIDIIIETLKEASKKEVNNDSHKQTGSNQFNDTAKKQAMYAYI